MGNIEDNNETILSISGDFLRQLWEHSMTLMGNF